jgi:hypothetical protein
MADISALAAPRSAAAFARLERLAPLMGLAFVALVIVGGPALERSIPGDHASAAHVIAFYGDHRARERAGAIVLALAFAAFLFFAGALRALLRRSPGAEALAAVMFGASAVLVAGQTANEGIGYALSADPTHLAPAAAQTLGLLANDLVLTSAVGFLCFGIAAGLAILRGGALPAWLGWSAIAIGILFVIPPVEFAGFLLLLVWIAAVSVLALRRGATPLDAA